MSVLQKDISLSHHSIWDICELKNPIIFCINVRTTNLSYASAATWQSLKTTQKTLVCRIFVWHLKATFSIPKIIPKSTQMYTLYSNLSFCITFTILHYIGQGQFCKSISLQMSSLETGGVFSPQKNPHRAPQSSFSSYKKVSRKNGDHEWFRIIICFQIMWFIWKV